MGAQITKPDTKQIRTRIRHNFKQQRSAEYQITVFKLLQEKKQLEKKINSLERKLYRIGDAEEQRDWLLDELTKKITTIGEIRTDLLKRERLSAIGELSSRLAHDMRNPLSIILNTVDLIKTKHADDFSPDAMRLFLMIDRATSRISFQLDEVLNFVRNSPLEIQTRSLLAIIESSIDKLVIPDSVIISKPKIDFNINCDSRKLEAVFSNLIMNAIQAMKDHGKIDIAIHDGGQHVTIDVKDSGPGVPKDLTMKIFEPLFTTKSRGTGLGLATVKNLVERHFGSVSVTPNPTTFSIRLPKTLHLNNSD